MSGVLPIFLAFSTNTLILQQIVEQRQPAILTLDHYTLYTANRQLLSSVADGAISTIYGGQEKVVTMEEVSVSCQSTAVW